MKIKRTEKQFTKENLPIDFIKEAMSIACAESYVHKYEDNLFEVNVEFGGIIGEATTVTPWRDELLQKGYTKVVRSVELTINNSFDSYAVIFNRPASIQGYFYSGEEREMDMKRIVCQVNTVRWTNLLLKYGFLEVNKEYINKLIPTKDYLLLIDEKQI